MRRFLAEVRLSPVFLAEPTPSVVLDTRLVIQAANPAYLAATGRSERDLLGAGIFEAFPGDPAEPDGDGVQNLAASLDRVLATQRAHDMVIQRYPIPPPDGEGEFIEKVWAPVNSPVRDGDEVVGVLHRVDDVTDVGHRLQRVLRQYRDLLADVETPDGPTAEEPGDDVAQGSVARVFDALLDEVTHLRRAMTSRATIEQAKGIVMHERGCSPEAAFRSLARASQETNVKLAEVAAALVSGVGQGRASAFAAAGAVTDRTRRRP